MIVTEIVKGGVLTGTTGERIARIESPQIMTENMSRRTEDHRIETEKFMIRRKREAGHVTDEDQGQGRERCRLAEERNPVMQELLEGGHAVPAGEVTARRGDLDPRSVHQGQGQRNGLRDPSQRSGLRDQDQENAHQGRQKGRIQEKGVIVHDLDLKSSWTLPTGLTDLKRPRPG